MITKNINGNNLNANYDDIVKSDNRDFLVKLLLNGTEINCGIKKLEITKGSCGDVSQFSVGNLFSSTLIAELLDLTDDLKNKEIEVQVGLLIDESNDTYEYITMGYFNISEVQKNIYGSTITGYGSIVSKSGGEYHETTSKIIYDIKDQLALDMGVSILFDFITTSSQTITKSLYGLTCYEVLQILAATVGGYATELNDGRIIIRKYKNTITGYASSGLMTSLPEVEEKDFEITGVQCITSEASSNDDGDIPEVGFEAGDPINLQYYNPYETQETFYVVDDIIGYTYRPGEINLSLGDPRLEGNDVLEITDADDQTYIMPCHQIKHIYDGGFRSEITSAAPSNIENEIGTLYPYEKHIQDLESDIVAVEDSIGTMLTDIQYFWSDSQGAHICTIGQKEYHNMTTGQTCIELLIQSSQILFRKVTQRVSSKEYTNYAIYTDSEINLRNYGKLNSLGLELINPDNNNNIKLLTDDGIIINGEPFYIDQRSRNPYTVSGFSVQGVGMINTSQSVTFTVPVDTFFGSYVTLDINTVKVRILTMDGSKILESSSTNLKEFKDYDLVHADPEGSSIEFTIDKGSQLYFYDKSSGVRSNASSYTPVYVEGQVEVESIVL